LNRIILNINFLSALFFFLSSYSVFTQDTTKPVEKQPVKQDTTFIQNFIMADNTHWYLNKTSPDTLTRNRFLWYPAKSLEDIFNYIPGYYLYYMDVGQLNPVAYNQMLGSNTGVLRGGRPINDLIDGSIDWNLFSRNEISEIELSNGYGNNVYGYSNTVNIIQRQLFQFRPYTEISYYQDRYENLYFDGNFHQNLFETINFNFGITKHSYDGHYTNSDFDKWLGRFNLTFAPSSKLNFFANVNYASIKKGLNEGIRADTVNLGSKTEIFNTARAIVNNPDAYEKKERFDIDVGSVFLAGKSSFTKLQLYVSNSFREYRDEENRPTPNGIFIKNNYHWINYGAKLQQQFKFILTRKITALSKTEGEYSEAVKQNNNLYGSHSSKTQNVYLLQELSVQYGRLGISGYFQGYTISSTNSSQKLFTNFYFSQGASILYIQALRNAGQMRIKGVYNYTDDYFSLSAGCTNSFIDISSEFYYYYDDYNAGSQNILFFPANGVNRGVNSSLIFKVFKFKLSANHNYSFKNAKSVINPEHSGKLQLAFEDNAFRNKLEYKIGLDSRFWSEYSGPTYNGILNKLGDWTRIGNNTKIPANATLDFFIMGKIGKATFGLTVENILDRIIYNTGVYPFMDRGGFLNSISRFNITWNFFD
jgi:hypothetical protein